MAISVAAIKTRRTRPWFTVGWLWYLGTLVPVIGIVQVGLQAMADRYTYVPLTGLFIIIAWGGAELVRRTSAIRFSKELITAAALIAILVLSSLTWLQLGYWRNSITLYKHTVAVIADNDILHYNLGKLLLREGQVDQTIEHWRKALIIKADQPTIHKNLAVLLARQGNINEAIKHYQQALTYKPNDTAAQQGLKALLKKQK